MKTCCKNNQRSNGESAVDLLFPFCLKHCLLQLLVSKKLQEPFLNFDQKVDKLDISHCGLGYHDACPHLRLTLSVLMQKLFVIVLSSKLRS